MSHVLCYQCAWFSCIARSRVSDVLDKLDSLNHTYVLHVLHLTLLASLLLYVTSQGFALYYPRRALAATGIVSLLICLFVCDM